MPGTIRFHLDENCPNAIADGLRRRGIDVTTSQEAGLIQASDPDQIDFARREGSVIFTQGADFLRLSSQDGNHCGVAYCKQQTRTIGEIVRGLSLIWEVMEPVDMSGHVEFL